MPCEFEGNEKLMSQVQSGATISCSDCNWTRTQNHLVHKGTLNHLTKLVK